MIRTLNPPQSWIFADDAGLVAELTKRDRSDLLRFGYDRLTSRLRKRAMIAFAVCLVAVAAAVAAPEPPLVGFGLMLVAGMGLASCAHQLARVRRLLLLMVLDLESDADGFVVREFGGDRPKPT